MTYDLVIRGGTIVDGTGAPRLRADVGVRGGRIAAIGKLDGRAKQEVDAEGHIVAPGFIDGHTHMDAQIFWDALGSPSCFHGVTTAVMGNCGFTLAPSRPDEREMVVRTLERAEDISRDSMAAGIDWSWETFGEFLDAIDRLPKGINYAANIGHSALRTWAMGERAFTEAATEDDMRLMEAELAGALAAGAIGFTTSRSDLHETSDDRPVPSRQAEWGEVQRLVHVLGEWGGIFELAMEPALASPDPVIASEAASRLRDLAVSTGVTMTFGVFPTQHERLALIDGTVAAGGRMIGQTHSRGLSIVSSFKSALAFDVLPEWREVRCRSLDEQDRLLRDPGIRARLRGAAHTGVYPRGVGAAPKPPDYELLTVLVDPVGPNLSVAEMARRRAVDPVDLIIDLALETNFEQLFVQPSSVYTPDEIVRTMKHPNTVMTFSDAGAHVSQIIDCSIQAHLLARWVRQEEAFTLEEAVRMITSVPADVWGLRDRGRIRTGWAADLVVFDPDRIAPQLPRIVNDLPGNGRRLVQGCDGIRATVVAGDLVLSDGDHTGRLPGAVLRRQPQGKTP